MIFPFVLAFLLGLVELSLLHVFGKKLCFGCEIKHKLKLVSFGAGISVFYLLTRFLPEVYEGSASSAYAVFAGFLVFFAAEKYVYGHVPRAKLSKDLQQLHLGISAITSVLKGVVLYTFALVSKISAVLFVIPLFFLTATEDWSLHFLHRAGSRVPKILAGFGVFFGVLIASFAPMPYALKQVLLGLVAGFLLFVVINEIIPKERKGNTAYFIIGILAYAGIELLLRSF